MEIVMKRIILATLIISAVLNLNCPAAGAWAKLGHATIGHIAQEHLTHRSQKTLEKYLDGRPLAAIASDADAYRGQWTMDLGFVPTNIGEARPSWIKGFDFSTPDNIVPYSHMITVDQEFNVYPTDNLNGEYIDNIAYYVTKLAQELKDNAEDMDPYERYKTIALIVHFVGDMHCPVHIVYRPDNVTKGKFKINWKGESVNYHGWWDKFIFDAYYDWSFSDMASLVDTANKKQIAEITKGDIYDYAQDSARSCWSAACKYKEGDTIDRNYPTDARDLLFSQLRNAGYRLAKILNDIL